MSNHWLYRWYDTDGHLLYLGITMKPRARTIQHEAKSWWARWATRCEWEGPLPCRADALARERLLVAREEPVFNRGTNPEITARQRAYVASRGEAPDAYLEHYPRNVRSKPTLARPVELGQSLWDRIDTLAARRGITRSEWVAELVEREFDPQGAA